jgi:hypothetical protein
MDIGVHDDHIVDFQPLRQCHRHSVRSAPLP